MSNFIDFLQETSNNLDVWILLLANAIIFTFLAIIAAIMALLVLALVIFLLGGALALICYATMAVLAFSAPKIPTTIQLKVQTSRRGMVERSGSRINNGGEK
jgi:hypothetical protein